MPVEREQLQVLPVHHLADGLSSIQLFSTVSGSAG